ncbi:MAG: NRDE family protein [Acidobacteria bacterium]|nr:MAG: NRDE family protein [Acidobacteriota bacterium]MCE7958566.1 NRDE family protein [Acidobacteria bacterium ACB2]
MCLVLLAVRAHPLYPLVVAANRDEFHARPSAPARFWEDAPGVLAGRDLEKGGAWLGVTRSGRVAALTNFRDPRAVRHDAASRGALVSGFLSGAASAEEWLGASLNEAPRYNPFNLVAGVGARLLVLESRTGRVLPLGEGVHGISNALVDTPWPKVTRGKAALSRLLARTGELDPEALLSLLADREPAEDAELPDTGVGVEKERLLSPPFIVSERYGTRSSTVLLLDAAGRALFVERSFDAAGGATGTVAFTVETGRGSA